MEASVMFVPVSYPEITFMTRARDIIKHNRTPGTPNSTPFTRGSLHFESLQIGEPHIKILRQALTLNQEV